MAGSGFLEVNPNTSGSGNKPSETIDLVGGKANATRYFRGPYANRLAFIYEELLNVDNPFGNTIQIVSNQTLQHPDISALRIQNVSTIAEGSGTTDDFDVTEGAAWDRCLITVEYGLDWLQGGGGSGSGGSDPLSNFFLLEENHNPRGEFLSVPGGDIIVSGPDDPAEGVHIAGDGKAQHKVVYDTMTLNQKNIVTPNFVVRGETLGKLNLNAFISPAGWLYPVGTLRYDGNSSNTKVNLFDQSGILDLSQGEIPTPHPVWIITDVFEYNKKRWDFKLHEGVFKEFKFGPADTDFDDLEAVAPFEFEDFWKFYFPDGSNDVPGTIIQDLDAYANNPTAANLAVLQDAMKDGGWPL